MFGQEILHMLNNYLRILELYKKWNNRPANNWAFVRNQLDIDDKIKERIRKYM